MNLDKKPLYSGYRFGDVEELLEAAELISEKAQPPYKHSAYLYFIARYIVAIFEAKIGELPLQVWNEYRNALDHFMRHITSSTDDDTCKQIAKMEGHIQRAILDACKYFYYGMEKDIKDTLDNYDSDVLRLFDSGNFIEEINSKIDHAHDQFSHAKTIDSGLGNNSNDDKDILAAYLEPCFTYSNIEKQLRDTRDNLIGFTSEVMVVKKKAKTRWDHLGEHIVGHLAWYVLAWVISLLYGIFKTF